MSEFKFACPKCRRELMCDTSYAGSQITCPLCQQAIVVPAAPARGGSGGAGKILLLLGLLVVVCAALGAGWFFYSKHSAKVEAAKGNPAAQVATPSAASASAALDILSKVHDAYTNLNSLSVAGTSVSVIDMSQVTAADLDPKADKRKNSKMRPNIPKSITNSTEVAIRLMKPGSYRIESHAVMDMGRTRVTNTTAVWVAGGTNYSLMMFGSGANSFKRFVTIADRRMALQAGGQTGGLSMAISQLFFDETAGMDRFMKDWGKTEDDSVNGQDCYTLVGKMLGQKLKIWVNKSNFMLLQSQITLGGAVSDADIDAAIQTFSDTTNQARLAQEKAQAKQMAGMMTKVRGTVTETYDTIEMNQTFAADDFNYPVPRGVRLTAQ